jgi:hypothetical protein
LLASALGFMLSFISVKQASFKAQQNPNPDTSSSSSQSHEASKTSFHQANKEALCNFASPKLAASAKHRTPAT